MYISIKCGFIPSVVWRFLNNISSKFRNKKLDLNRQSSYMLGIAIEFWLIGQVYGGMVCVSVHSYVSWYISNLYVHWYVCTTISTSVCSYTVLYAYIN